MFFSALMAGAYNDDGPTLAMRTRPFGPTSEIDESSANACRRGVFATAVISRFSPLFRRVQTIDTLFKATLDALRRAARRAHAPAANRAIGAGRQLDRRRPKES